MQFLSTLKYNLVKLGIHPKLKGVNHSTHIVYLGDQFSTYGKRKFNSNRIENTNLGTGRNEIFERKMHGSMIGSNHY